MSFKHYIRSIEGKTEAIPNKPSHQKPVWFNKGHVNVIFNPNYECCSWFVWAETPQGHDFWSEYEDNYYDELPPEPREIIDSWIAQVDEEVPHVFPAW